MKKGLIVSVSVLLLIGFAQANIITLREGDANATFSGDVNDGYFNENVLDTHNDQYERWINDESNHHYLSIGTANTSVYKTYRTGMLKFDLTQLSSGLNINSATLTLFLQHESNVQYYGNGSTTVHEYLNSWDENTGLTINDLYGVGTDFDASVITTIHHPSVTSGNSITIDLTSLTQDWYSGAKANNGIVFSGPYLGQAVADSSAFNFFSSEYSDVNLRPILTLSTTQTLVPEPSTYALVALGVMGLGICRRRLKR